MFCNPLSGHAPIDEPVGLRITVVNNDTNSERQVVMTSTAAADAAAAVAPQSVRVTFDNAPSAASLAAKIETPTMSPTICLDLDDTYKRQARGPSPKRRHHHHHHHHHHLLRSNSPPCVVRVMPPTAADLTHQLVQMYEQSYATPYNDLAVRAKREDGLSGVKLSIYESQTAVDIWTEGLDLYAKCGSSRDRMLRHPSITWAAFGTITAGDEKGYRVRWFIADGVLYRYSMCTVSHDNDHRPQLKLERSAAYSWIELDVPHDDRSDSDDDTRQRQQSLAMILLFASEIRIQELTDFKFESLYCSVDPVF